MKKYSWPLVHNADNESSRVQEGIASTARRNLASMRASPNRAQALGYFDEIITGDSRVKALQRFNGKIIGTYCNFVPEELIYAAGAIPIRLCAGFHDTIAAAEKVLPPDVCPLVKSSFGAVTLKLPYFNLCQSLIVPTSCDGKKKLAEILGDYLPVWTLELPQTKNIDTSLDRWLAEIIALKKKLESFSGVKISKARLKSAIDLIHIRTEAFRRLHQIRKSEPPVISGRDVLLVIQCAFYDAPESWIEKTNLLCDELEAKIKTAPKSNNPGPKTKRLLLTGAPLIWPNYQIINTIEESGAVVVADELCSGTRYLYDSVEVDEWTMNGMLRALGTRYLYPATCPCFARADDRIDRIIQLVTEFGCRGVVYHNLRLCQNYSMEQELVKSVLADKKIPMLSLQADYSQENLGALKTRVEAFIEMI
ncbi:MAG: double-cubane-cluster-containing anaerobic reductase [Planctomycetota bacterium]